MKQLLVRGALLIDGTGRPPIEKGAILIEGERIIAVGKEEDMDSAPGFECLDCGDEVLIPGLIDCHNHLALDPTLENWPARMNDSETEQTLRAVKNLAVDIQTGVTTARCLGDKYFLDLACKRAIDSGRLAGPRILAATRGIRATHGHGIVGYPFDGPDQVRQAVRENLKAGADVIKLFITGTVREGKELPCFLSREEISLAVQEAHRVGKRIAAHCIGGIGFEECLSAGVDSIEHGYFATDREIDLLMKSHSWLVLTPIPYFEDEFTRYLPPELANAFERGREEVAERLGAAIRSGVNFAVGTDALHGGLPRAIEHLVKLGASENEALAAATRRAAIVLGLENEIGTLEPGKSADLVGIKGNPLKDIRALRRVSTVIQRGKIFICKNEWSAGSGFLKSPAVQKVSNSSQEM
jgi:imidazolonepropionase-like amidohydrolase